MPKKLLFISKDNLTTNPRLAKELKFAVEAGYEVDFVGFDMGNWSNEIEKETVKNISASFHYISATRKPFLPWFVSSLVEKFTQKIYTLFKNNLAINAYSLSKRSILINQYFKSKNVKYDLIVAHHLSTFYPAYILSKKLNIPLILDIEDYHPGEQISDNDKNEKQRREFLMKTILPKAAFITYASPLIGEYSLKLIPDFPKEKTILINNCFSQTEFQFKENNSEKVKFVWFSQNIAKGRGLEFVAPALEKFKNQIELTLIGNLYPDFYENFLEKYSDFMKIEKPLSQKELNLKLSEFDIGLAIEPGKDLNNTIALSNKIFAYAQSGLYIFATDTPAQNLFLEENKNIGLITKQNNDSFENSLKEIIKDIQNIRTQKFERFEYSKQFSWENEREKLFEILNKLLLTEKPLFNKRKEK